MNEFLEIRGARRRLGDTKPSEVKKYLFLETLMATRERLVLSYPCHDIVKDAEQFPSGMICELKSFVEKGILPQGQKFREVKLPLLERGKHLLVHLAEGREDRAEHIADLVSRLAQTVSDLFKKSHSF